MARRSRRRVMPEPFEVEIESLSHEGRGICHHNGKTVFVFGALPGETVKIEINKTNKTYAEATTLEVIKASPDRVDAHCPHFSLCGGCSMQHVSQQTQLKIKQQSVLEMMEHAGLDIGEILPPITSEPWGYRRKARLGVKFVIKKQRLLVGFRERNKPYLADIQSCAILVKEVGMHLTDLMALITEMDAKDSIAQIEVATDDDHCMLVFRHLKALSDSDLEKLTQFAKDSGLWVALQPEGPDSITPLYPELQELRFKPLANNDISIRFKANDFTQVNAAVNQAMVQQALDFLDLQPEDKVLDLFCGLGNFTLPMAQLAAQVTGVEGDEAMVNRARENAVEHGISNTEYFAEDLTKIEHKPRWMKQKYDKILLDPPRSGAFEVVEKLKSMKANTIVYVSCQPTSLVRDALLLCKSGYRLTHLGLMDMFPHTAHVESMAVFNKKK